MFEKFRSRGREDETPLVEAGDTDQVSTLPEVEPVASAPEGSPPWSTARQETPCGEEASTPSETAIDNEQCSQEDCSHFVSDNNESLPADSSAVEHQPPSQESVEQEEVKGGPELSSIESLASARSAPVVKEREGGAEKRRITPIYRLAKKTLAASATSPGKRIFTPEERLLLLDTWRRSGLSAADFAALTGLSKNTLHKWNDLFRRHGPEGLMDQPRKVARGSRLPDLTIRTILMLKESHPEWGCQRISDMLVRGPALTASASAVARVLHAAGYEADDVPTRTHVDRIRRFERAKPNQLWQTDLFTFTLKRQNRRLYLVAFMDDHSRFIVSYGLHASASTALVLEALEAGIASYGPPEEMLTDNGPQYVTWRGKSRFTKQLEKRGIRQIVSRPRRPQTLGKIERFWGTLWREFLEAAVFVDLGDARTRIGLYVDYYNLQRVHHGIGGVVPADRYFGAAQDVLRTLKERAAANSLDLARHGQPRRPFYVTGQMDGQNFSVYAEGERLILRHDDGERQEVTLNAPPETSRQAHVELPDPLCPQGAPAVAPGEPATLPPAEPGTSAIDALDATDTKPMWKAQEAADTEESEDKEGGAA